MSKIEVNTVEPQCGTTLTLGASGDTVTLGSGASQSGFGRTGTVDWDTTVKTASFTATNGEGYFVNTTSGAVTVTLPASPSAGNIVAIMDYANTAATNNITVARNSSKIDGVDVDGTISTNGESYTLVFIDSTEGWKTVNTADKQIPTALFVTATGGTVITCGNFKIHTFTGPGTFTVSCAGNSSGSNTVSYAVVAGGGGGGSSTPGNAGAGGGAGGYREGKASSDCYTASPLNAPAGLPVTAQAYPITVGGAGSGSTCQSNKGGSGGNSSFSTITSAGGGGGGSNASRPGVNGGSGGGGSGGNFNEPGGTGNTPPVSPPQGTDGGNSSPTPGSPPDQSAGGGGGATEAGVDGGVPGSQPSGRGGAGATTNITGSPLAYAGGGGGGKSGPGGNPGAASPCGTGGAGGATSASTGTTNRGGGGGGANTGSGANGGSGVVIIRYKFQ